MTEALTGFKVVREFRGHLLSALHVGQLEYFLGAWVEQPGNGGPLAVFDSLESATRFRQTIFSRKSDTYHIYLCRYCSSNEEIVYTHKPRKLLTRHNLPPGTSLATRVKLVELVPEETDK